MDESHEIYYDLLANKVHQIFYSKLIQFNMKLKITKKSSTCFVAVIHKGSTFGSDHCPSSRVSTTKNSL